MIILLIAVFIPFFFVNIYVHEYIHYRQASCQEVRCQRDFLDRFGWGWKEDAPSGAVAYMDVSGCPTTERVNEWEPLTFNLAFSIVYIGAFSYFLHSNTGSFVPNEEHRSMLERDL